MVLANSVAHPRHLNERYQSDPLAHGRTRLFTSRITFAFDTCAFFSLASFRFESSELGTGGVAFGLNFLAHGPAAYLALFFAPFEHTLALYVGKGGDQG